MKEFTMRPLTFMTRLVYVCSIAAAASGVAAEEGVSKTSVLLGYSGEYSGQAAAREGIDGALVYFASVNKRGGVFGRKIELKVYDDGRDVKRAVENTERLIHQDKVFALFGYKNTPTIEAVLPLVARERVPLITPFSGSSTLREPLNPQVFHLRASYEQEAEKLVEHLSTVSIKKIAILYQDDAFGKNGMAAYQAALKARGISPVAVARFDRREAKVDAEIKVAVKAIAGARPDAVLMACGAKLCVDFIKQVQATGQRTQFLTLSNVNSAEFAQDLKGDGHGVVVAQIVPYPWSPIVALSREFQQVLKDTGSQVPLSYASFEGFIAAKLIVMALQRAGPELTRERFLAALEGMEEVDLGGMTVRFSRKNHTGSNFVDLTLIGKEGKYVR
jgi:branched-chain amino acid transport system substrate-binding protein